MARILVSFFRAICAIRVAILSCSSAQFLSSHKADIEKSGDAFRRFLFALALRFFYIFRFRDNRRPAV